MPLGITNTIEAGRDKGVYVLSSPHGDGTRLSGVFSGTTIYAICMTEGFEAIPGERRWVKASFDFVAGDVAADGSFANPRAAARAGPARPTAGSRQTPSAPPSR